MCVPRAPEAFLVCLQLTEHMEKKASVTLDDMHVTVTKADGLGVEKSCLHQGKFSSTPA